MIQISRNGLLLLTFILFTLVHFIPRIMEYFFYPTAEGQITEVIRSKNDNGGGYSTSLRPRARIPRYYPFAQFQYGDFIYTVQGPVYYDMESCPKVSDKVTIIFDPDNPSDAKFLNLTGFWFNRYIWKILILLSFLILITTFLKKDQKIIIRYKKNAGKKRIEVTVSDEQLKAKKIANWVKSKMIFSKRRR